jgi:drug/metabolite transporter (DMT)-like permease
MQVNHCKNKILKNQVKENKNGYLSSVILLAILPKCPFCIMAYTSTAILCSNKTIETTSNSSSTIFITSLLSLLILVGIFFNYRGKRTYWSLFIVSIGIIFTLYSVIKDGGSQLYYLGIAIIIFGTWLNGSFLYFAKKLLDKMRINKIELT